MKRAFRIPSRPVALALCLVLVLLVGVCAAAEWTVPLHFRNGEGDTCSIRLGVHPDGTPGLDPELGEIELPPWPPSSLFEVRFELDGYEGLKLDIRDTTHLSRCHEVKWQSGEGGYPVVVSWNRSSFPRATLLMSDGYGGVFIPSFNMAGQDSLVVPVSMSFVKKLTVDVTPGVLSGAAPVIEELGGQTVFVGQSFADRDLDDSVFDPDTPDSLLEWIATGQSALVVETVGRVLRVDAPAGWLGSETITLTARDPEGHSDEGEAVFEVLPGGLPAWEVPLSVENSVGEVKICHFGIHPDAGDGIDAPLGEFALPPWPPSDLMDARLILPDGFITSYRDLRTSTGDSIEYHLKWQPGAAGYPVTVSWPDQLPLGEFHARDDLGGVFIPWIDMRDTTSIAVPVEQSFVTGLVISARAVVDTLPPVGPFNLEVVSFDGVSVELSWTSCSDEHFDYYEVLVDTIPFDSDAQYSWDWSEDPLLQQIATNSTVVDLPGSASVYYFRVRAWDAYGNAGLPSNMVAAPGATGAESWTPDGPRLRAISPNPTRGGVSIQYSMPAETSGTLSIYDVAGRVVRRMPVSATYAGQSSVIWDGRGESEDLASGVYFCRLEAAGGSDCRKVVLIR